MGMLGWLLQLMSKVKVSRNNKANGSKSSIRKPAEILMVLENHGIVFASATFTAEFNKY